ncbi:uncharacterized protein LOC128959698 [Oppia nitens]|uniref:uncharacterized protein LOC128959698 n=1 Tax=Oppia nitens TaxID=1686743 RepID=UPI0023DC8162|nr:uncharacterized protein LOC128959698 [Oppia nitens]
MDQIEPGVYGALNYCPRKFALDSFSILKNTNRCYDLIVDVGAGDGGITKLLATSVRHQHIVGVDVDPVMTNYADTNNKGETIEYVTQDMSVGWHELSPGVRELESKVDLIFSNFVLHYIPDRQQLVNTFSRLLSTTGSGGVLHANIIILADLNKKLVKTNSGYQPLKMWYQSCDKQLAEWEQSLRDNQLVIKEFKVIEDIWQLNRKEIIDFLPVLIHDFRPYFQHQSDFDAELADHLPNTVFDAYVNSDARHPNPEAWTQFLADTTVAEL